MAVSSVASVHSKVKGGEISGAYLVFGEEHYWHQRLIDALAERFEDGADTLPGDEVDWGAIADMLGQPSFFGPKLWVVREAHSLFSKDSSPRVPRVSSGNCLLLSCPVKDNPADKGFLKDWAEAGYTVCKAVEPSFSEVVDWISHEFAARGFRIARDACEELMAISGRSLDRLSGEIDKICLFLGGNNKAGAIGSLLVSRSVVSECASRDPESNTFGFTDAMASRNAQTAIAERLELESRGYNPILLVAVLANHFGLIWRAKEAQDKKMSQQDAANYLGVHPYAAKKAMSQSKFWSYGELEGALRLLLYVDESIKKGRVDPTSAMDHLVMGICAKESSTRTSLR